MNLRQQVEVLLPDWERWYPSLFDAASDLGLIKAEVCDPNTAIKPLAGLISALVSLVSAIPARVDVESSLIPASMMPSGSTIVLAVMAVFAIAMIGRMLED